MSRQHQRHGDALAEFNAVAPIERLDVIVASASFMRLAEPMQAGFQAIERMEYLAYSDDVIVPTSGFCLLRRPGEAPAFGGVVPIGAARRGKKCSWPSTA